MEKLAMKREEEAARLKLLEVVAIPESRPEGQIVFPTI
jgi:hypothetical protein